MRERDPEAKKARRAIWMTWDWELNNAELGRKHGITGNAVSWIRRTLGKPPSKGVPSTDRDRPRTVKELRATQLARIRNREWRKRNPEKQRAIARRSYQSNRSKVIEYQSQYRAKNRDAIATRMAIYRRQNREALAAAQLARYYKNRTEHLKKQAEYRNRVRPETRMKVRQRIESITDGYVREQLSKYSTLSTHEWPQSIVDAKKTQLMVGRQVRLWRNLKTSLNSETSS